MSIAIPVTGGFPLLLVAVPLPLHVPGSRFSHPCTPARSPASIKRALAHIAAELDEPAAETAQDREDVATDDSAKVGSSQLLTSVRRFCWKEKASSSWQPSVVLELGDSNGPAARGSVVANCRRWLSLVHALQGEKCLGAPLRGASAIERVATHRPRHLRTVRSVVPTP